MQRLIKEVKTLVSDEYAVAAQKFGPINHSDHESFAVLGEEVEELRDEFTVVVDKCQEFWKFVKSNASNDKKKDVLKAIRNDAIMAACEAIQVAAMAYKAEQTIIHRGEEQ